MEAALADLRRGLAHLDPATASLLLAAQDAEVGAIVKRSLSAAPAPVLQQLTAAVPALQIAEAASSVVFSSSALVPAPEQSWLVTTVKSQLQIADNASKVVAKGVDHFAACRVFVFATLVLCMRGVKAAIALATAKKVAAQAAGLEPAQLEMDLSSVRMPRGRTTPRYEATVPARDFAYVDQQVRTQLVKQPGETLEDACRRISMDGTILNNDWLQGMISAGYFDATGAPTAEAVAQLDQFEDVKALDGSGGDRGGRGGRRRGRGGRGGGDGSVEEVAAALFTATAAAFDEAGKRFDQCCRAAADDLANDAEEQRKQAAQEAEERAEKRAQEAEEERKKVAQEAASAAASATAKEIGEKVEGAIKEVGEKVDAGKKNAKMHHAYLKERVEFCVDGIHTSIKQNENQRALAEIRNSAPAMGGTSAPSAAPQKSSRSQPASSSRTHPGSSRRQAPGRAP